MDTSTNALNWFEIPAVDIKRAKSFYQNIFEIEMEENDMDDGKMAFFPLKEGAGKAAGAVVESPNHIPSGIGTIVYLNANPKMDGVLDKVEAAGGKIVVPKMSIGENGHIAFIVDTEGNKVGIHSKE